MTRNEEYIQNAFNIFYKLMDQIHKWGDSDLKNNIMELNKKHLLSNLDKALVQEFNEDTEGETNND
jgi:hypothetical protein